MGAAYKVRILMAIFFESSDLMYTDFREMSRENSDGSQKTWHVLQFRDTQTKRYTEMTDWSRDLSLTGDMKVGAQYYVRGWVNFTGGPRGLKAFLVIKEIAELRAGERYDPMRGTPGVAVILRDKHL